jgi:Cu2+-exporting ATPase
MMTEGMLLTRGDALHEMMRVDTVLFDKTGTLTLGQPAISQLALNPERPEHNKDTVMSISAAMEAHSNHPVARAFAHADFELPAENLKFTQPGGLVGKVGEKRYYLGSPEFVRETTGEVAVADSDGDVFLADGQSWLACFSLTDRLREGSAKALTQLAEKGLDIHMVSGDGEAAVGRVAAQLGINSWSAKQQPEQKLHAIKALQEQGRVVLMVGDGANDGPVLAAANVSMTVQGATELANSTADVILTSASMELLSRVFEIAARARSLVRQNLSWALIYNASVMPLAMSGTLKPWMAALGMSASSLLVVLNASRLSANRNPTESTELIQA